MIRPLSIALMLLETVPKADGVIGLPAVGAWVLPFAVILLLAFSGGGYDLIVRGQVGIVL